MKILIATSLFLGYQLQDEKKFDELINEISILKELRWNDPIYDSWIRRVLRFLKNEFGEGSDFYNDFYQLSHPLRAIIADTPDYVFQKNYLKDLEKYEVNLRTFLKEIKENNKQRMSKSNEIYASKTTVEQPIPIFGPLEYTALENLAFVLMPFKKNLDRIYQNIIKPAVESKGLDCKRADDYKTNKAIMQDIWKAICRSRLIIADMTGLNPNVMYELGISHTIGKPTIIIYQHKARNKIQFPFDLAHIRRIEYENTATGGKKLDRDLSSTLDYILHNSISNSDFHAHAFEAASHTNLPSLIATFDGIDSAGRLLLNVRNIGNGAAKQVNVNISVKEKPSNVLQRHNIQLLEPGQVNSIVLDTGYPAPEYGVNYGKIDEYYKKIKRLYS